MYVLFFLFLSACYANSMLTSRLDMFSQIPFLYKYAREHSCWLLRFRKRLVLIGHKYPLEWHLPIKIDRGTREWRKLVKKAQAWFPTISAGWRKVKMFLNCSNAPVYIRSDNQTNIWQIRAEFPSPAWNVLCGLRKFR